MATREDLRKLQEQPLEDKVQRTLGLISEWYAHWDNQCYVSFSGGKDSNVLADIAAKWCSIAEIPLYLVFVDTGLEYPEIKEHVRDFAEHLREKYDIDVQLTVLRPKMTFCGSDYTVWVSDDRERGFGMRISRAVVAGKK